MMDHSKQQQQLPLVEKEVELQGKLSKPSDSEDMMEYDRLLSQQSTFLGSDSSNSLPEEGSVPTMCDNKPRNTSSTAPSTPCGDGGTQKQYQHQLATITNVIQDDTDKEEEEEETSSISLARLMLVLSAAIFGINFSMVKILDGDSEDQDAITVPVGESVALRFAWAAGVTSPTIFWNGQGGCTATPLAPNEPMSPHMGALFAGLETGLYATIGVLSQAVGLETTSASKSAFLFSLAMVVVPLLDLFFSGKPAAPRQWLGAGMAVLGVAFMELDSFASLTMTSRGDLISLLQPVAFGVGFWRMEHWMRRFSDQATLATAYQVLTVFCLSSLYSLATSDMLDLEQLVLWLQNPRVVLALFWSSVISTALAMNMQTFALRTLSATEVTLLLSTEPLWGAIFAAVLLGERFTWQFLVGGIFILSGCLFANLDMRALWRQFGCCCTSGLQAEEDEKDLLKGKEVEMGDAHSVMSALTAGQGQDSGYGSRSVPTYVSTAGEP